uniref:cytochrome c maturation subunit Fc2 n=1 Tax=Ipomoea batatas TaxID=4120 RepID=UPI002062744B|nr:cytochrome c maturation subunit Fc2 [Ipomoea batatas]UZC79314.1 cytochrome c maturation subunit Fc2 [Ipomoea batatas]DAZ87143.1 TPA_asm: Cytochrome c maturation subunit Fc2 [Ipomoea batatas]DAZ87170.1 TPA_asm: Cytochrome c maturation subunit Fc2 [Ipomoea trifida]DAZ87229.1 TPA_asm: Cytochrome c maturation subunit Fc2 [Ipomoea triloba]
MPYLLKKESISVESILSFPKKEEVAMTMKRKLCIYQYGSELNPTHPTRFSPSDWLDISISPSSSASEASTGVRNELASSSPQELSDNFNKNRILRFFQEKIEEIGGGGLPSSWSPEEFTRLVIGEEETTLTEEQGDENGDDVYLEAPPVKGQPGHDYYQKVNTNMKIPHGGVCLSTSGVLLSNTKKIQFTQRLPLGSELHMGKERCCLRGLDHLHGPTFHSICGNLMIYKPSLTNDRLMLEHDESLRADLLPIHFPASYENGKLEQFFSLISRKSMKNHEQKNFCLTMFPEKRYFQETTSTTEVAIHTNLFTDLYALIGTGSGRKGGWYTTIMKKPFLFSIRKGFSMASSGGSRSLLRKFKGDRWPWG